MLIYVITSHPWCKSIRLHGNGKYGLSRDLLQKCMTCTGNNQLKQVFLRIATAPLRQRGNGIVPFSRLEHAIDYRDSCHCTAWQTLARS